MTLNMAAILWVVFKGNEKIFRKLSVVNKKCSFRTSNLIAINKTDLFFQKGN